MATIIAVCRSDKKGTRKENENEGVFRENFGLVGDAHADTNTHRQVSLLDINSIKKMQDIGLHVGLGDFAENLTTEGIELFSLPVGTRMVVGQEVILEISQIGKECHNKCAIYRKVGQCIMPEEGVFAVVVQGGMIRTGDKIEILSNGN